LSFGLNKGGGTGFGGIITTTTTSTALRAETEATTSSSAAISTTRTVTTTLAPKTRSAIKSNDSISNSNNKALDNTVSYADVSDIQHSKSSQTTATRTQEKELELELPTDEKTQDNEKQSHISVDNNRPHKVVRLPQKKDVQGIHSGNSINDTMTMSPTTDQYTEEDRKFLDRVRASVKTVQNWDNSTNLLRECRSVVPWDDLKNPTGPYSRPDHDWLFQDNPDALFLQRLCRWFPTFMSWVNAPPCRVCGCTDCEMKTVRGPITDEEKEGEAKRVEGTF
jgi:hypothetical protein